MDAAEKGIKRAGLGWLACVALPVVAGAEGLWVDRYFGESCVLQREAVIRVRGGGAPHQWVEVEFRGTVHRAEGDLDGRWEVACGPYSPGGPDAMEIRTEKEVRRFEGVRVGDVWLFLGQSNMAYTMAPYLPWTEGVPKYEQEIASVVTDDIFLMTQPRFIFHEAWDTVEGTWLPATPQSVRHFSAVAWYTMQALRARTSVPLGAIVAAIGSTGIESWLPGRRVSEEKLDQNPERRQLLANEIKAYTESFRDSNRKGERPVNLGPQLFEDYLYIPSGCHNALVHPLTRYPVAGWIWYQGEGNAKRAATYAGQLRELIDAYRDLWKQPSSPFMVVQLPGYLPPEDETGQTWAELRDAQRTVVLQTPATALITTLDLGDPERIHPTRKKPVGERCAEAIHALSTATAPLAWVPQQAVLKPNHRIEIRFTGTGEDPLSVPSDSSFSLVGTDGSLHESVAVERTGTRLLVRIPADMGIPTEIRYAFENLPTPALFQPSGAPVSSFRLPVLVP